MHTTSTTTPQIHEKLSINPIYSSQTPHTYMYILATTAHTTSQIQQQQLQTYNPTYTLISYEQQPHT